MMSQPAQAAAALSEMPGAAWSLAQALYLFAPLLGAALLSAVIHRYDLWPRLARPIDGGLVFRGRRLFGDGKTWRGACVAIVGAFGTVLVQTWLGARVGRLAVIDYETIEPLRFAVALGGGAIVGELPNSFVKRRLGIPRGETAQRPALRALFWVWDQIDLLTATWPALWPWLRPSVRLVLASLVLTLVLHPLAGLIGYWLGARQSAR